MTNFLFLLFLLPLSLSCEKNTNVKQPVLPWIVYYGNEASSDPFASYNPIVFHHLSHPPLESLLKMNKEILGYIDLTETEETDNWFSVIKEKGFLIKENPNWPGSWIIDIRQNYWKEIVINQIIPYILNQGFTGLFFDQLDVAIDLENQDPKKFQGMTAAVIDLIQAIRKQFPRVRIMMNRAYEILPHVGNDIDYELAETLYTSYNFTTKQYYVRPAHEFEWQLSQLDAARASFPHLVIFSLDYWDPNDKKMYQEIYAKERQYCINPYVSTISLDSIN